MILSLLSMNDFLTIIAVLVAFLSALFISMPFHEFAHAHAALKEGDPTAKILKRYTLAPFSHIDAKGLVFLLLFSIGFAKPVPIDSRNFKRGVKSELRVDFAGVLVNLLIAILSCFLFTLLINIWPALFIKYGFLSDLYYYFFNFMISINFMFVFFNILPIYPLDGFRVVEALSKTENNYIRFMKRNSFWIMLVLLITGILSAYISLCAGGLSNWFMSIFDSFFAWVG